jgi:hypothetical protein
MKNLKIHNLIKNFPPWQIFLFVIFVIYVIFPIPTPTSIAYLIDSSLGMIFIFCITLFLFLYTNPVLAITYVFVAYELLRRSSTDCKTTVATTNSNIIKYPNTMQGINSKTINNNVPDVNVYAISLEEEFIKNTTNKIDSFIGGNLKPAFNPLNYTMFTNATKV